MSSAPSWRSRFNKLADATREGATRAAEAAREAGERARPVAQSAVERAAPIARENAERGKAFVDRKREERRQAAEAKETWFLVEDGPVHTAGYPDEESMRAGIQAASEHGWRMESIANVPARRAAPLGGLTGLIAKEAIGRITKPDRFLVTFRKFADEAPAADPAPDASTDAGETTTD